eukprot:GILK01006645.1.p1 GENE.GILK01006645.1~~GILK01006645.1.p1  ORF type:complete len:627 (+),score=116.77 GILK01006645.1:176-1882(+)
MHDFPFEHVFDQHTTQQEVFSTVAQPVILSCLEGYNGTIFTYGQTGSGKTYTMSGGETYAERGVIPLTLGCIFEEFRRRPGMVYNAYISFLEIYNEHGYDLLDRDHGNVPLDQWPKVTLFEDDFGNLHLRNLSIHQITCEEEGLDLLFLGNVNRMVSETPMNQASSRSHCIFTIAIEGREANSDIVRTSKLHLVDLAGSERVQKTQIDGSILREAKYINLSLHYLEQVIIALQEKANGVRSHIPYRNSMMTSVLRDSLGGNCKTVMIATLAADIENLEESISTARFAQRCSMLTNEVTVNEQVDMNLMVQRLERENEALKKELQDALSGLHTGALVQADTQLTDNDKKSLANSIQQFINDPSPDSVLPVKTVVEAQLCFRELKMRLIALEEANFKEVATMKQTLEAYERDVEHLMHVFRSKELEKPSSNDAQLQTSRQQQQPLEHHSQPMLPRQRDVSNKPQEHSGYRPPLSNGFATAHVSGFAETNLVATREKSIQTDELNVDSMSDTTTSSMGRDPIRQRSDREITTASEIVTYSPGQPIQKKSSSMFGCFSASKKRPKPLQRTMV